MGKAMWKLFKAPLISQSNLICFSVLYLSISLFLAHYTSFIFKPKCLFQSSQSDQTQIKTKNNLFSYPASYGDHKYALQTIRSNCSSPIFFSDYSTAVKEIDNLYKASSSDGLKYMKGSAHSFGGNFNAAERFSYFRHENDTLEVPCGFFKDFPIGDSDRIAMENCRGVVVVSAIFNDHDKIRQPRNLGPKTLQSVCFFMFLDDITLKALDRHESLRRPKSGDYIIGAWKIVEVSSEKGLYENPAMNGVIPKFLVHRLFPNAKFSVWIDAKLSLTVDPLLLVHSLLVSENADVAISRHPVFMHTMEEASATARWNKWWDFGGLRRQMETYCEFGLKPWSNKKLPYISDVPDSALIFRKHDVESNLFSCLLFNELEGFNPRDQLAFAFVRDFMRPKLKVNMFEVQVFEQIAMEYRHNLKKPPNNISGSRARKRKRTKMVSPKLMYVNSSCYDYLLEMWGEIPNPMTERRF